LVNQLFQMKNQPIYFLVVFFVLLLTFSCKNENTSTTNDEKSSPTSQEHPKLILTAQGVKDIRAQLGNIPIFDKTLKKGVLYQILDDEKYAKYVKDMLMQYEALYKTLPLHPKTRSYARGKLFWQCLNDSNWLVYVSQAYDCIYNYLTKEERNKLETNLFRPFADHISVDSPQFYQRVHNHSTWGNAAVGMIGLVMDDQELIDRALIKKVKQVF